MASALAVVVVIEQGGRFLLVRRAHGRPAAGYWTPVTGRVEEGETLENAARREALEEVGLRVSVGPEVFRCAAVGAPFELVWFRATLEGSEGVSIQADEVAEARWCTPAEVEALEPMFDETRRFLARQALSGELR